MTKQQATMSMNVPETPPDKVLSEDDRRQAFERLRPLLKKENAVVIAHYYTAPELQQLADETGGFVGDSLAMAEFGLSHPAKTIVVAGVRFMGESAKILSPENGVDAIN